MTSVEIRVLEPTGIEDYHAHLLRLDIGDRNLFFASEADDRDIDGHCLQLLGAQAILIGGYVDNVLRAGLEILPDRTARQATAIFTAETGFCSPELTRMLIARLLDEACRYRLANLALHGLDDADLLQRAASPHGIEIVLGSPMRLHFSLTPPAMAVSRAGTSALAAGYA
jgi:hypothetical protein